MDKKTLIEKLELQPHVEGGYFRRSFQADHRPLIDTANGPRFTLTSIYYLLTDDSPCGHWHCNQSDILHYFHLGAPVTYYMVDPDGRLQTAILGADVAKGEHLQLAVPGGTWKASHLPAGEYGLLSEAVAPGFDYADMTLGNVKDLVADYPQHQTLIEQFARP